MRLSNSVLCKLLFKQIVKRLTEQRLPVKVQLWTGEEYRPSTPVKTEVALRNLRALLTLAKPTLGGLARSYVEQEIDLAGDTRGIIELGVSFCRPSNVNHARGRISIKWRRHSKSADTVLITSSRRRGSTTPIGTRR